MTEGRAPMLGRAASRHGSCCGGPSGPDCDDRTRPKREQRHIEKRQWERQEGLSGRSVCADEDDEA